MPKNLSPARNGTPAVQPAALKAMRSLGGAQLRPVRGTVLLTAHIVNMCRRSVLPNCDRVSLCMSLQQNALYASHSEKEFHFEKAVKSKANSKLAAACQSAFFRLQDND